ncbi:heme exporter protein CcmD [Aquabacterium sp.]|jgi:heme exporter protein D|uniref:heme exporter protein CcmD n=1 Tax=Aquabacterium sp. TaxID=1872578 RepID=UPI0025B85D5F|nr:heme exporter protein CcmD [Aquabacterium sp.]
MNGNNWADLLTMGGYGLYVWGAVGVVLGAMALELGELWLARRALLRELRRSKGLA